MSQVWDDLSLAPGELGGMARASYDRPALPSEDPSQTNERQMREDLAVQRTQLKQDQQARQQQRITGADFAARGVPSWKDESGSVQPILDVAGAPLTNYDKKNSNAWDSLGNPVAITPSLTGAPTIKPAFEDVPITTDAKTGDQYRIRPGLPYEWAGKDPDIAAENEQKAKDKAVTQAVQAVGGKLSLDEHAYITANHDLKAAQKRFDAIAAKNDIGLDSPVYTAAQAGDLITAHKAVDDHFNTLYGSPEANATKGLFSSELSPAAQAMRSQLDVDKAEAHKHLEQVIMSGARAQGARTRADQTRQVAEQLQTERTNVALRAVGLPTLDDEQQVGATAQSEPIAAQTPDGKQAAFIPFDPAGPAFQQSEDGELALDPTRLQLGLTQALKSGAIDKAKFDALSPKAKAAEKAIVEQAKLLANDSVASKLKALGVGVTKGGIFLAAAPAGAGVGAEVGSFFGPAGTAIGGVLGGLASGTIAAFTADKVLKKLADHSETIKSFVDASESHPYYSAAGELVAFGTGLPKAGMKVVGGALAGDAGIAAKTVGQTIAEQAAAKVPGATLDSAAAAKAILSPSNLKQAAARAYDASGGGLKTTITNFAEEASRRALAGASTAEIAKAIGYRVGQNSLGMAAVDTAIKEGARAIGLSDEHQTAGGVAQSLIIGAFVSGHGFKFPDTPPAEMVDLISRARARNNAGVGLGDTLTPEQMPSSVDAAGAQMLAKPLTPREVIKLGAFEDQVRAMVNAGKIKAPTGGQDIEVLAEGATGKEIEHLGRHLATAVEIKPAAAGAAPSASDPGKAPDGKTPSSGARLLPSVEAASQETPSPASLSPRVSPPQPSPSGLSPLSNAGGALQTSVPSGPITQSGQQRKEDEATGTTPAKFKLSPQTDAQLERALEAQAANEPLSTPSVDATGQAAQPLSTTEPVVARPEGQPAEVAPEIELSAREKELAAMDQRDPMRPLIVGRVKELQAVIASQQPPTNAGSPPEPPPTQPLTTDVTPSPVHSKPSAQPAASPAPSSERTTKHRIFEGGSPMNVAAGPGVLEARNPKFAYRSTGQSQIDDMLTTGTVRAREGKMKGGHTGETQWSRGHANLGYRAESSNGVYVIETRADHLHGRAGALPLSEVTNIYRSDGKEWVDVTDQIKGHSVADISPVTRPEVEPPTTSEPVAVAKGQPADAAPIEEARAGGAEASIQRPRLGNTVDEVISKWKEATHDPAQHGNSEAIVAKDVAGGKEFFWGPGDELRVSVSKGGINGYRPARPQEEVELRNDIARGIIQIERQQVRGMDTNLFKRVDAGKTNKILHQATGSPLEEPVTEQQRPFGDINDTDKGSMVTDRKGRTGTVHQVGKSAVVIQPKVGKRFAVSKADVRVTGPAPTPTADDVALGASNASAAPALTPEAETARKFAAAVLKTHSAELQALGHPVEIQTGETPNKSGIMTNSKGRIIIDPAKVAEDTKNLTPKGRLKKIKRAVAEEVVHVATIRYASENSDNFAKVQALAHEAEWAERGRDGYGPEWDGLNDFQKGAEIARILIQGKKGKLTESAYRYLLEFVKWLRKKLRNLSPQVREVLSEIEARMGKFRDEVKATKAAKDAAEAKTKQDGEQQRLFAARTPERLDTDPARRLRALNLIASKRPLRVEEKAELAKLKSKAQPAVMPEDTRAASTSGQPSPSGQEARALQWLEENQITDLQGNLPKVNSNGTVTLYHRTTPEKAQVLRETGKFKSLENTNETYFSTKPDGQIEGYGSAIIAVDVPVQHLQIDDAFDNEIHFRVANQQLSLKNLRPESRASKAGAPSRESILPAYQQIAEEKGFPAIPISELQKRTGADMDTLKAFLKAEHNAGHAVLSRGDWSIATPEERAGVIPLHGEDMLQVRFQKKDWPKSLISPLGAAATPEDGPFYSQLARTVQSLPQATMTVAQAKSALTKGAKPDEVKMSGILDDPLSPLNGKADTDKVTRYELADYAMERATKVQDVVLGAGKKISEGSMGTREDFGGGNPLDEPVEPFEPDTHFSNYQLPGADPGTYREMFVLWPDNQQVASRAEKSVRAFRDAKKAKYGSDYINQLTPDEEAELDRLGKTFETLAEGGQWEDGHTQYTHIINPVVRIRRNIRTAPDGTKTYFIEEMQGPQKAEQEKMPTEVRKRIYEIGMKRAIRDAIDSGADSIAWTTGEQQAERYSLEKQVDSISYNRGKDEYANDYGLRVEGKNGETIHERSYKPEELEGVVGKEMAAKILNGEGRDSEVELSNGDVVSMKRLSGLDLKVGGEGLKRLYDVTLPRIASDLAKKFGGKVGKAEIETGISEDGNDPFSAGRAQHQLEGEESGIVPKSPDSAEVHSMDLPVDWKKSPPSFALFAAATPEAEQAGKSLWERIKDPFSKGKLTPEDLDAIGPILRFGPKDFYQGMADKFKAQPWTHALGVALENSKDLWREIIGKAQMPFRTLKQKIGGKAFDAAAEQVKAYRAQVDSHPGERQILDARLSPDAKSIVQEQNGILDRFGTMAEKMGVMVQDDAGNWRPFKKRQNYFPRIINRRFLNALENPAANPKDFREAVQIFVKWSKEGRGNEAIPILDSAADVLKYTAKAFREGRGNDHNGNIEHARTIPLPNKLYDYSFEAFAKYVKNAARRLSQIKHFGQKTTAESKDLWEETIDKMSDVPSREFVARGRDITYGVRPRDAATRTMAFLNSVATGTQLSNPITTMANLIGGISDNVHMYGLANTAKGILEMRKLGAVINDAYAKGLLHEDLMDMANDAEQHGSNLVEKTSKAAQTALRFAGYNMVEEFNRALSLVAGKAFLREGLKAQAKNPESRAAREFISHLEKTGVDPQKVIAENGEGRETDRYHRKSANESQGGYGEDQTPQFINTPLGQFLFKYQKWGTQHTRFFMRRAVDPAMEFIRSKGKSGSMVPLFRYALLTALAGLGLTALKSTLFGSADPSASLEEIQKTATEDQKRAFVLAAQKMWKAQMAVSAGGIVANYAQMALDVADRSRFKNPLTPPGTSMVIGTGEQIFRLIEQKKLTLSDLDDFMRGQVSAYRTLKAGAARAADATGAPVLANERARQDASWLGTMTRRFADEVGVEASRTSMGRVGKTEMSPVKQELLNALRAGDVPAAKEAFKAFIDATPKEQRGTALTSIKATVQASQPVRVGTAGEARREIFLSWAQRRLGAEDIARVKEIDKRYRDTAAKLGLINTAPASPKSMASTLTKLNLSSPNSARPAVAASGGSAWDRL